MRLTITGRHIEVTEALRQHIDSRMQRLERYGMRLDEAQVILEVEKYRHTAEVILALNGAVIQGKESTNEMYASIDRVFDQMRRRIQKRKEILSDRKSRASARRPRPEQRRPSAPLPAVQTVRTPLPTLTVEQAVQRLALPLSSVMVFLDPATERVQVLRRLENGEIELIDPRPV